MRFPATLVSKRTWTNGEGLVNASKLTPYTSRMPHVRSKLTEVDVIIKTVTSTIGVCRLEVPRALLRKKRELRQYIREQLMETTLEDVSWLEDSLEALHIEEMQEAPSHDETEFSVDGS